MYVGQHGSTNKNCIVRNCQIEVYIWIAAWYTLTSCTASSKALVGLDNLRNKTS